MSNLNPVLSDRWTSSAARLLNTRHWQVIAWLRSVADDAGYIAVVSMIIMSINFLRIAINDSLSFSMAARAHAVSGELVNAAVVTLIDIVLLTIAIRVAPRQGVYRWVAVVLGAGATMFLGNRYFVIVVGADPSFDHVAQGTITVVLITVACLFHSTARSVESELFRTQIDNAGLEAEFNRAQLDLLRAQIEPHFLFNTLATVRTLARADRPAAAEMTDNLLRYFAGALPKLRQDESTLADEIDLIDAYLCIQKVRMGDRLSYRFSIPADLLKAKVPSVMLLTLVENAIKHGISPATAGGTILVSADRHESVLTMRVADDGEGMQAEQGHGSGLANIRARLSLLYRHRARLSLLPAESRGVVASIQIPMELAA